MRAAFRIMRRAAASTREGGSQDEKAHIPVNGKGKENAKRTHHRNGQHQL